MKIAVVIDTWFPFVGGGQKNAWQISKIIASSGHKIDIITRNNGKTDLLKSKNLKVIQLGSVAKASNTFSQIKFCFDSLLFLVQNDYDIIHAHAFLPGITIFLNKLIKKTPTVFTVHGTSINSNLKGVFSKIIEAIILTKIPYSCQITVSRDFLEIPNINDNVIYIPNGVNFKEFGKIKAQKKNIPTILFVGRLHPQKNILKLIEAFSKVKKVIKNVRLIIAGDGIQKDEVIERIISLHLEKDISLLGGVKGNELIRVYKSSSIFVLPSLYEGQPLSLLEALASKLPPVVSAVGDNPYLVNENRNGFIIKNPNSVKQITEALLRALKSKNLNKVTQYNYNLVKNNFSWQKSAQQTFTIYEKVANR